MPTVREEAERIDLRVQTPNEQLTGRLRGKYDVSITIAPGYAERAGEAETAAQLGRLARLLFTHRADRLNRIKQELMQPGVARPESEQDAEFERRYAGLAITESSPDGRVSLTTVGLSSWTWRLESGTVDDLGSSGLSEVATDLANAMALRLADEVRALNIDVYHGHG